MPKELNESNLPEYFTNNINSTNKLKKKIKRYLIIKFLKACFFCTPETIMNKRTR
jgi:hypothetical protein